MPNKVQCGWWHLSDPDSHSMAWLACQKEKGHKDEHKDCYGGESGWWADKCPTYVHKVDK